jgi:hypothetical protein
VRYSDPVRTSTAAHALPILVVLPSAEDAIMRAMLDGRGVVAEELARALKARREAASRNVIRMPVLRERS